MGTVAPVVILSCTAGALARSPETGLKDGIAGQVVDAEGTPVASATVFLSADPNQHRTTDKQGRFRFSHDETRQLLATARENKPWRGTDLVVVADGYGIEWIKVRTYSTNTDQDDLTDEAARNMTIRLVRDDVPIRGKLVDGDGVPVPDAHIMLGQVMVLDDLTAWLDDWESSTERTSCWRLANYAEKRYVPVQRQYSDRDVPPVAVEPGFAVTRTTDDTGHFSIRGIGRDRAVWLRVEHPRFVTKTIFVATREGFTVQPQNPRLPPLHAATFRQPLEPFKRLHGTVREHGTGKPLENATVFVQMHPSKESGVSRTTTDRNGTFEITGLGEADSYRVVVASRPGQPHVTQSVLVDANPGLAPQAIDFDLYRGTVVKGFVTNAKSGEPVYGASLTYFPAPGNEQTNAIRKRGDGGWDDRLETGIDGRFDLAVPTGPGLVAIRVRRDNADRTFQRADDKDFPYPLTEDEGEYFFRSADDRIVLPGDFHAFVKVESGSSADDATEVPIRIDSK